ncbi:TonB-dependent receptor plug domain-containing protein [Sphingobacterium sp. KU25419]|nr:TonB-dependent receptor plug domain-containing protein [Sphingobacterium sp. KU25419]
MKKYKYLIIMKMIIMLLLFTMGQLHAGSFAQTVSIKKKNSAIVDIFREIKKQTGYTVLCKSEIINNSPAISVDFDRVTLDRALSDLLTPQGLTYVKEGKSIVVKLGKYVSSTHPIASNLKSTSLTEQKSIHGQVTDQNGKILSGVSVTIKGTKTSVGTDQNGYYSIAAQHGAVLQFNFLGYERKEMEVISEVVNVSLQFIQSNLEEVVVTGYGTFKKSDYTGSASTIRTERMSDVPAVDFSTMLQGNAPGVQVNSLSGQPGGSTDIRIRGMGSINASSRPLFVIDGVPVMSGDISSSSSNNAGLDVMSTLSNADIEQITVIKDAAAASLYGSRAAGGVILITTKSGKAGKPVFSFKGAYGLSSQATDFREVMDGPQRREMLLEGLRNRARYIDKVADEVLIEDYAQANIDKYAPIPWSGWTDWKKELFRKNSPFRNADLSASGGDGKLSYYTSMGYTNQTGLSYQSGFERITGRLNVKYKMSDKLELGANILYSNIAQDVNSEGGSYTSPIYSTRHKITASEPVYNEDGSFLQISIRMDRVILKHHLCITTVESKQIVLSILFLRTINSWKG